MAERDLSALIAAINGEPPSAFAAFAAPRQGKTTLCAQLFFLCALPALFINWQRERILYDFESVTTVEGDFEDVREVLSNWDEDFPPKINWVPNIGANIDDLAGEVDAALLSLYESNLRHPGNPRLVIFCDEAQFYSEKQSAVETLAIAGPRFGLQVVIISQFPERLQNKRLLGALTGGFVLFFLDESQRDALLKNYGYKLPEDIASWCEKYSYRAYFYDQSSWVKIGDGSPGEVEDKKDGEHGTPGADAGGDAGGEAGRVRRGHAPTDAKEGDERQPAGDVPGGRTDANADRVP